MNVSLVRTFILLSLSLSLSECNSYGQKPRDEAGQITVTTVQAKDVTLTQKYVCQIHSHRHISVQALVEGTVGAIPILEGQPVKRGDLLFQIGTPPVSIKAPFDGIVGRLLRQQGSVVLSGESLTTLSDNSVMWVYFDVPEQRYLEYMAERRQNKQNPKVELFLADRSKFPQAGKINAIDAEFNRETGGIAFRADFPNPTGVLRHGQTGIVSISHVQNDAIAIPQRATFEVLDKRYVYVVDKDDVAHRREVDIENETEDLFVIEKGVGVGDRIVLDGVRLVRDGDKVQSRAGAQ